MIFFEISEYFHLQLHHDDSSDDFVIVDIYYLPLLMIATAHCEIRLSESNGNLLETNLLQDFLKYINDEDLGESLPYSETSLNVSSHKYILDHCFILLFFYSYKNII